MTFSPESLDAARVVESTRAWIERVVIGFNLCPFARPVHAAGLIRYVVSPARSTSELAADLERELRHLDRSDPAEIETTLLIHPDVLGDFLDYNDFVGVGEAIVGRLGLTGTIQLASFHPAYRFAGSEEDDAANWTNRSPYPMLHLLREASVSAAIESFPESDRIYERNIATMRRLGSREAARLSRPQGRDPG